MSMDPPKVLLEQSFLMALTDTEHAQHADAIERYRRLVELYQREEVLLFAVGQHLDPLRRQQQSGFRRAGLLAPVDPLHVAFQHHRVAHRAARMVNLDLDFLLTLVMCERHKVHRLATYDQRFAAFHLDIAD